MNPYLLPSLEVGPRAIERLMDHVDPLRIDLPTHPDRFTPREVVAHLADWEPIFLWRMKQCLQVSGGTIEGIDEGVRAVEQNYAKLDWREQSRLFKERRAETAAWLRSVKEGDWEKFVVHNERGKQTLYDQANMLLGHDLYHIDQLCEVVAASKAVGTW